MYFLMLKYSQKLNSFEISKKFRGDVMRFVFVALSFMTACLAQDATRTDVVQTPTWSGSYTADFKSRYFGSTVCEIFADQKVLQQEVDVTKQLDAKTSITGMVWNSTGFTGGFRTFAAETDAGISMNRKIGRFDLSGTAWLFFLNPTAGFDVFVLDAKASRTFAPGRNRITPFAGIQNYALTNKVANHGGVYPMVGAAYERKLTSHLSLVGQAHGNYDVRGGFGEKSGKMLFYSEAGFRITLSESTAITPRVGLGGSFNDPGNATYLGRPRKPIFMVGISKTF